MPAASLTKVDTTSQSWLVLPKTQGTTGYRCVCLSRAAQAQSWGLAVSLVSLSQAWCLQCLAVRMNQNYVVVHVCASNRREAGCIVGAFAKPVCTASPFSLTAECTQVKDIIATQPSDKNA